MFRNWYTIPAKHALSHAGGRPPFGRARRFGSKGSIRSHIRSSNSCSRALLGMADLLRRPYHDDAREIAQEQVMK